MLFANTTRFFFWIRISAADAQALTLLSFFVFSGLISSTKRSQGQVGWDSKVLYTGAPVFAIFFAGMKYAYLSTAKDSYGDLDGTFFNWFYRYGLKTSFWMQQQLGISSQFFDGPYRGLKLALATFFVELVIAVMFAICVIFAFFLVSRCLRWRLSWYLLYRRFLNILVVLTVLFVGNQLALVFEKQWGVLK